EAHLQAHAEQRQAFHDIAELVNQARRCYLPQQYREVQQRLAAHLERVDGAASSAKEQREQATDRLRRLRRRKVAADPGRLAEEEARSEHAAFLRTLYLRLGRQYRTIGDLLAWQLYQFQTLPIVALGMNASPGPIAGKAGVAAEAQMVEDLWHRNQAFAL